MAETVLYSFCPSSPCTNGALPYGGLIIDASGNLYGTTYGGGAHSGGTVFELTPNTTKTAWTLTVLYNFGLHSPDDGHPLYAGLTMDEAGHLYGTTENGGTYGVGTVYELTPNSTKTAWTETVLYSFCPQGGGNAAMALPLTPG